VQNGTPIRVHMDIFWVKILDSDILWVFDPIHFGSVYGFSANKNVEDLENGLTHDTIPSATPITSDIARLPQVTLNFVFYF